MKARKLQLLISVSFIPALIAGAASLGGAIIGAVTGKKNREESARQHDAALGVEERNYQMQNFWNQQNFDEQRRQYDQNFALQQEQQQYDRGIQQKLFDREDNAIQRRVADMRAANINPVLAAGNAANAGGVVASTAPQMQVAQREFARDESGKVHMTRAQQILAEQVQKQASIMQIAEGLSNVTIGALQRQAELSITRAQADLIRAQTQDMPGAAADRRTQAAAAMSNSTHMGTQAAAAMANALERARENDLKQVAQFYNIEEQKGRITAQYNENYLRNNTLFMELENIKRKYEIDDHDFNIAIENGVRSWENLTDEQRYLNLDTKDKWRLRGNQAIDNVLDLVFRGAENLVDTLTGQRSATQDLRRGQRANRRNRR